MDGDRSVQRFREGARPEALRARKRQLYRDLDTVARRWGEAAPVPDPVDEDVPEKQETASATVSDYSRDEFEDIEDKSDVVPAEEIYAQSESV